jgi:hypothetical protein
MLLLRTCQWVDVPCCVTNDQQVVIKAGGESLAAQAQAGSPHALKLGVGAQRSTDEGVLQDEHTFDVSLAVL